jgi:hypothetical protein
MAHAQTRKIAHRSHSGRPATYAVVMKEDHLGGIRILDDYDEDLPIYNVEPFIKQVKLYYENIAKRPAAGDAQRLQVKPTTIDTISNPRPGNAPMNPAQPTSPRDLKKARPGNQGKGADAAQAAVDDVPHPAFLVGNRVQSAEAQAQPTTTPAGLWLLLGLLAFPVAPGIFLATAWRGRQSSQPIQGD